MRHILIAITLLALLQSCSTEIDVYAPPKEAYYVACVLDPGRDTQYVRMSRVFQSPGDAYAYADTADLSVRGWDVVLEGGGRTWHGQEHEFTRDSGLFSPGGALYYFLTDSFAPLQAVTRYELSLRKPGDQEPMIRSHTTVPTEPTLLDPGPTLYHPPSQTYSFEYREFMNDVDVRFRKGNAYGFEVRVWVHYLVDGQPRASFWGPSRIRSSPLRCRAVAELDEMCVQIREGSVPNVIRAQIDTVQGLIEYPDSLTFANSLDRLPKIARVEVTAADSALTRFLVVNDGATYGLNMLMDKPEYSNIGTGHFGIFGAVHSFSQWIFLGECTKYHCGLRPTQPTSCP